MNEYSYDGPVLYFDTYVEQHWKNKTIAVSEAKARNNLTYRYKKENGYAPNAKITLPGKIVFEHPIIVNEDIQIKMNI